MAVSGNKGLNGAKGRRNDEFYTRYEDVAAELSRYHKELHGMRVYCNCNDIGSAFWKYLEGHFDDIGLEGLWATDYVPGGHGYLYRIDRNAATGERLPAAGVELSGDGDFRSAECMELLGQCDVAVTNPPFSLFREYVRQLVTYRKRFIVLGTVNVISYKEIFPLFKSGQIRAGYVFDKGMRFSDAGENGPVCRKVSGICFFTNLPAGRKTEPLPLVKQYDPALYPRYDNFDAVNVDRVADIPADYDGPMGVPVTFLGHHCPEQFEILGILQCSGEKEAGLPVMRTYDNFIEVDPDGVPTGASGRKANGHPVLAGKPGRRRNYLVRPDTGECVHAAYARIVIQRKGERQDGV